MRRPFFCLIALVSTLAAARAESDLCRAAASGVEASLRAFRPGAKAGERISIRHALARKPAAGIDYGAPLDDATLRKFPITSNDRAFFKESTPRIFRSGGKNGLVLLDAEAGAAHCHSSFLFSLATDVPVALALPASDDPNALCAHGGVALGSAAGTQFFAQTYDDSLETDWLRIFRPAGDAVAKACAIDARYAIATEVVEKYCAQPDTCAALEGRVAQWAQIFGQSGGKSVGPALAPIGAGALPEDDPAALPLSGLGNRSGDAPRRFDGGESWFALTGDNRADVLRIGAAAEGPASRADSPTLATLYKGGQPVASFVVQRRRGAFQSLAVRAGS